MESNRSESNKSFWLVGGVVLILVVAFWGLTPFVVAWLYPVLEHRSQFGELYGPINALFAGLAFAGIIAAILLQRQELQLQRQELASTREELARTADAQERQVNETRVLQRAYVTVEPDGIHALLRSIDSVAHIKIVNSGNLPAYNVAWGIAWDFDTDPQRQKFGQPPVEGRVILSPKGRMTQGSGSINFPGNIVTRDGLPDFLADGEMFLYVWGRVAYTDGFEELRVTEFCHRYNCSIAKREPEETSSVGYAIPGETARHHLHGNSAD
jgi:hypothetical protein